MSEFRWLNADPQAERVRVGVWQGLTGDEEGQAVFVADAVALSVQVVGEGRGSVVLQAGLAGEFVGVRGVAVGDTIATLPTPLVHLRPKAVGLSEPVDVYVVKRGEAR